MQKYKLASIVFFIVALANYLTAFLQPDSRSTWAAIGSVFLVLGVVFSFRARKHL